MLFGPTLSNSAQASDPVAQGAKVVVFGTSNTADGITSIGNYVFRNSVTEADILPVTLKIAAQKTGLKRVAVLYGNDDIFTKSGYDNFKKALQDLKIPVDDHGDVRKRGCGFQAAVDQDQSERGRCHRNVGAGGGGRADHGSSPSIGYRFAVYRRQRHELTAGVRAR